jgi:hypothetical protein
LLETSKAFGVVVVPQQQFMHAFLAPVARGSGPYRAIGAAWLLALHEFGPIFIQVLRVAFALFDNLVAPVDVFKVVWLLKDHFLSSYFDFLSLDIIG